MRLINTILERIANKFGYYKFPRYYYAYIKSDKMDEFSKSYLRGQPRIFNYCEMLKFKAGIESIKGWECKVELIRSKAMFKNKKDGKIGNWLPNKTKGVEITNINEAISGKQLPVSRNDAIK